jgi:hypothetical protein
MNLKASIHCKMGPSRGRIEDALRQAAHRGASVDLRSVYAF